MEVSHNQKRIKQQIMQSGERQWERAQGKTEQWKGAPVTGEPVTWTYILGYAELLST